MVTIYNTTLSATSQRHFSDGLGGVKLLTNNKSFIDDSLRRIGYEELEVVEIPFSLNVPKGIPFYSAHYKVDVFRYLATLPEDEYSILLDSDVVCMREFPAEYYELIKQGVPSVYYLNAYGGVKIDSKARDLTAAADSAIYKTDKSGYVELIGNATATQNGNTVSGNKLRLTNANYAIADGQVNILYIPEPQPATTKKEQAAGADSVELAEAVDVAEAKATA